MKCVSNINRLGFSQLGRVTGTFRPCISRTFCLFCLIALLCRQANAQIPTVHQVVASDGQTNINFGTSVALSGNLMVVGADAVNSTKGAAYVYTFVNGAWVPSGILTASDGQANDAFGVAVAVNASTHTIVVGAPNRTTAPCAAYVFTLVNGAWTQTARLTANDGVAGDGFGNSLGLSGSTIVIGAPVHNNNTGAAYVFTGSGSSWTQKAELLASDGYPASNGYGGSGVGFSAAISGNTIVVGANRYHSGNGAAYVFSGSGNLWTQKAELVASDGQLWDSFGCAVAISGNIIVVGANYRNSNTGAAYVFTLVGVLWHEDQILTASIGQPQSQFGYSVSASGNGRYIAVGAPGSVGAGYANLYDANSYGVFQLTASNGQVGDYLGWCVALNGNKLAAGAFGHGVYTSP